MAKKIDSVVVDAVDPDKSDLRSYFRPRESRVPQDEGAVGDGITNDSAAIVATDAALASDGGGEYAIAWTANAYVIGDGSTNATGFTPTSHGRYRGKGGKPKLIHRAKNAAGQNRLFHIANVDGVTVENLECDGEGEVRNHITMDGVVRDAVFRDLHLHDGKNFAIQYADNERDPDLARFERVTVLDVVVDGNTGATSQGSGFVFFNRAQRPGLVPASRDLYLDRLTADITNGSDDTNNHGPQGFKIQNTDGVYVGRLRSIGGRVGGYSITTGVRNLYGGSFETRRANAGVIMRQDTRFATTRISDIHPEVIAYLEDGVTGGTGSRRDALQISGAIPRMTVNRIVGDGNVYLIASEEKRWRLTNVVGEFATRGTGTDIDIVGGTSGFTARIEGWSSEDPEIIQWARQSGTPQVGETITDQSTGATAELVSETDINLFEGFVANIVQLRNGGIFTDANGLSGLAPICGISIPTIILNGGSSPRGWFRMASGWPIQDSVFGGFIARRHHGNRALESYGIRNRWGPIISVNGNPTGVSAATVVEMKGDHETFELISIQTHSGTHEIDFWFKVDGGSGGHTILGLAGTVDGGATHRGIDIINQEDNDPLIGNWAARTPQDFDLSGAATTYSFPIDRDARVLSIVFVYSEATSADAGVAIEVGVVGASTRFLNETSATETAAGTRVVFQNTSGTRSFGARYLSAGETLTISCAGGKAGDGAVGVIVNIVDIRD